MSIIRTPTPLRVPMNLGCKGLGFERFRRELSGLLLKTNGTLEIACPKQNPGTTASASAALLTLGPRPPCGALGFLIVSGSGSGRV